MKRIPVAMVVALGLLGATTPALASDLSLTHALKPYQARLTTDIGYLSGFATPSRNAAPAALRTLSKVTTDLSGATAAAGHQHASTSAGRKGQTLVMSALHEATIAANDARACATAAHAGNRSAATSDARSEQSEISHAITAFESGGKLLHLF